jgi:homoserine O-acetyltransferase
MSTFMVVRRSAVISTRRLPHFLRKDHRVSLAAFATAANDLTQQNYGHRRDPPNFPCVDAHAARESKLQSRTGTNNAHGNAQAGTNFSNDAKAENPSSSGPEPPYARPNPSSYQTFSSVKPLPLVYYPDSPLPSFDIAYETWGSLNASKTNAILLHTGLSASSHAASTEANPAPGWWEKFIGPGKALDTNQHFIICTNVLGGCYGSTGPSSDDPSDPNKQSAYATHFPILSIFDMVRGQFALLDELGIEKLYASVGCSMGAMQSLAAGWLHPERVGKVVSISGTARSSPSAIAMRFAQRSGTIYCALDRVTLTLCSSNGRS